MKKAKIILVVFISFSLIVIPGCNLVGKNNISSDSSSSTQKSLNIGNEILATCENFSVYQSTENADDFSEAVSQNNIDKNYNKDYYETATTTQEMIEVQKKYIDIWKDEMAYSVENITKILDENKNKSFLSAQKQWEDSTNNNLQLERKILEDSETYGVMLGSTFQTQWYSEVREAYRQRTIRIKYLNYLLETQTENPKSLDDCLSLKFKNS